MHELARCAVCDPSDKVSLPDSPPFLARYDGTCPGCGFDIAVGQQVRFVDDLVAHVGCEREVRRG
jgi:hypothetical protein